MSIRIRWFWNNFIRKNSVIQQKIAQEFGVMGLQREEFLR